MTTYRAARRLGAFVLAAALIASALVLTDGIRPAAAAVYAQCQNQDSLDWASLPDRSSPTTVTGDGVTYTLTRDDQAPATGSPTPPQVDYATVKTAIQGNRTGYYSLAMDPRNLSDHEELILTPDSPVAGFELTVLDVDIRTDGGNYRDVAVVTGSLRGAPVTAVPSALGSAVQYSTRPDGSAVVTGVAPVDNTSENGNATLAFPTPVDRIVIRYETGTPPLGGTNPTQQLIGIDDFRWCGASVGVAKSISSPVFDNGRYTVSYDYTLENNGGPVGVDPQIVEDLAARFGTFVAGAPTTPGTYTVGTPGILANSAVPASVNPAFTGSGGGRALLTPGVGALGAAERIVVRVPVTFVPSRIPFSVTNQVTGSLDYFGNDDGAVQADQTDVSTNGSAPDADGDGRADDDAATTPLVIQGTPVVDLAVTDDAGGRAREGDSVVFTYTAVNRGDVPLTAATIAGATPALVCDPAVPAQIPVGGTLTCRGSRVVTEADLARGSLIESPTVKAQSTAGEATDAAVDEVPVVPDPVAQPDASNGAQGQPQRIEPLLNDSAGDPRAPLDPASLQLLNENDQPTPQRVVPGQGSYVIDRAQPDRPVVVFTPEPAFSGTATPVAYRVADADGITVRSTITPSVVADPPRAVPDTSTGPQGVPQRSLPLSNDVAGAPAVPLDPSTFTLLDQRGAPVPEVVVPGQGTYTVEAGDDGPTVVFTPEPAFVGTAAPISYRVTDSAGTTATSAYTPTVTAVTPVASPDSGEGLQGQPIRIPLLGNDAPGDPAVPLVPASVTLLSADGAAVPSVTVPGQGVYTMEDGPQGPTAVFTPDPGFSGTPTPVTYRVLDSNGTAATSTASPVVAAVAPSAAPDTTTGPQGSPQQVDASANDAPGDSAIPLVPGSVQLLDAEGAAADQVEVDGVGTYTRGPGGVIVFTPVPSFTGPAPAVRYRIADANGTTTESTYAPTVTAVTPTAVADTTTGPQGVPQQIDASANDLPGSADVPLVPGSVELLSDAGGVVDDLSIDGVGRYTRGTGGVIVFTPVPEFSGTAPAVRYRIADANGTTAESTYTPTVTPAPRPPTALPDTTTGPQGAPQQIDVSLNDSPGAAEVPLDSDSVELLDADGDVVDSVEIADVGAYTRGSGGVIVFTPTPEFTGTAPAVRYRIADANGTTAESTYTPTVTPAPGRPAALPDSTSGRQGAPQQIDVSVNDSPGAPEVPLDPDSVELLDADGDVVDSVEIGGVGTYTRGAGGVIVFTPVPEFTGTAPAVRYRIADANGTMAESTYTPTVVPVIPTAAPDSTSGPQGIPQQIDVSVNDAPGDPNVPLDPASVELLDADGDRTDEVEIDDVGTYTRGSGGVIVFTPVPEFTGTAPAVRYRIADANGTTAESTYTPTVTPVIPSAVPDSTSGPQGAPQQIDASVNDLPGATDVPLDPDSVELLNEAGAVVDDVTIDDVGTYTRGSGGVIVFTPVPEFTGTAPAVRYRIADANGTTAESTYTPTATPRPGRPVALPDTSSGLQGAVQSVDPLINDTAGDPTAPLDPSTTVLVNPEGTESDVVVLREVGSYVLVRADDAVQIVFTPEVTFSGTAPAVTYRVADAAGATVESTYTPVVTAVTPVAVADTSSGRQGAVQQVDVVANDIAGDPSVPLDPASLTLLDGEGAPVAETLIDDVGRYSRGDDGVLVFTPVATFTGTAPPASYRIADANGTTAESTYTPVVTPAPVPVAAPDNSVGLPGMPQSIDPLSNDRASTASVPLDPASVVLLDASGEPVTSLVVDGVGRYSVELSADGVRIVFVPEPGFAGTAPAIRYRVSDVSGMTSESTYTASVQSGATPPTNPRTPDSTPGPSDDSERRDGLAVTGGTPLPVGIAIALLLGGALLYFRRRHPGESGS